MDTALIISMLQLALQYGPAAIQAAYDFYNTVKSQFSTSDQADLDAAFAAATSGDKEATAAAVAALDEAAKR